MRRPYGICRPDIECTPLISSECLRPKQHLAKVLRLGDVAVGFGSLA